MTFLRGGEFTGACEKDKTKYCWNAVRNEYQCKTPEPIFKPCSKQQHEQPAFDHKSIWECDLCGRRYVFMVYRNSYTTRGFTAEWQVKFFQRIMPWDKRA